MIGGDNLKGIRHRYYKNGTNCKYSAIFVKSIFSPSEKQFKLGTSGGINHELTLKGISHEEI